MKLENWYCFATHVTGETDLHIHCYPIGPVVPRAMVVVVGRLYHMFARKPNGNMEHLGIASDLAHAKEIAQRWVCLLDAQRRDDDDQAD